MQTILKNCEDWLNEQYKNTLGINIGNDGVRLRWLSEGSLTVESSNIDAQSLAIEDSDIGWLIFLLPYKADQLEHQINQALGLRSRLLRESNYTGIDDYGENEDKDSSWRIGLIWLVDEVDMNGWQQNINELRRESGVAEEISIDAVFIKDNNIKDALDAHGLPRLLLNTRSLMKQTVEESEKWFSADSQVLDELKDFSQQFDNSRARVIARELEEKVKAYENIEKRKDYGVPRLFNNFRVENFRNLDNLEITREHSDKANAEAIILFGPNGTGKSSLVEAISLAAFGTSPRLEQFMLDKDVSARNVEHYLKNYITPLKKKDVSPMFTWGENKNEFILNLNDDNKAGYEGVVLNQEDSIKFTDLTREQLAAQVLSGYSSLADKLSDWLKQVEQNAKDNKSIFTRKHGLNSAIKRSSTAYNRLAIKLLTDQLQRPPPEFIDWLRFLSRQSDESAHRASSLILEWESQQETAISRLAEAMSSLQEIGASQTEITKVIQEKIEEYDLLAKRSETLQQSLSVQIIELSDQLDSVLSQIDIWGEWLSQQNNTNDLSMASTETDKLKIEIETLAQERSELEHNGKSLRGRLELLDKANQFLKIHWVDQHPDICPVCDSNVADRQGIEEVVSALQEETNLTVQALRVQHVEIQVRQKDLDAKLKASGLSICPLAVEDQHKLEKWLSPFLPDNVKLKDWLIDARYRQQLKDDLSKMGILPDVPKPYTSVLQESERIAREYISLTQEADSALELPQAIGEVKKVFEHHMQEILKNHLPATLGKVWEELTLTLTTAAWLLPDRPNMKLEWRGKSLSVQVGNTGRYIRYIYNAAERHVLGLAWFFTYYLAKRRFDEAWIILDDPAQEMDQPSYRELVRFWETLLRLHQKQDKNFTVVLALHQEERALDAARATNGKLYILGWQKTQEDISNCPSVKKVVLLASGFHPLKPEAMFN